MKNTKISRLRRYCIRCMSENDIDYELPLMGGVLVLLVLMVLIVSI